MVVESGSHKEPRSVPRGPGRPLDRRPPVREGWGGPPPHRAARSGDSRRERGGRPDGTKVHADRGTWPPGRQRSHRDQRLIRVVIAAPAPRATFRDVFAAREFRALWTSVILSAAGDRLALVAIAVLVYDRTRSPLLAAVAYAAGYLPWVIGGLFLADLADRRPRRTVMVTCDAVRAVLVAAMAVP